MFGKVGNPEPKIEIEDKVRKKLKIHNKYWLCIDNVDYVGYEGSAIGSRAFPTASQGPAAKEE